MTELTGPEWAAERMLYERRKGAEEAERQKEAARRRELKGEERLEAERLEAEQREEKRLEAEQREEKRLEAERLEKERREQWESTPLMKMLREKSEQREKERREQWKQREKEQREQQQEQQEKERLEAERREQLLARLHEQQQEQRLARLLGFQNELSAPHLAREQSEWTKSEDSILIMQYRKGLDIEELAKRHLRSSGQIRLRLVQIMGMSKFYSVRAKKRFVAACKDELYGYEQEFELAFITTYFFKDQWVYWTASREENSLPYDILIYDDPDTIVIRDGFDLSQIYLNDNLVPEDHFNSLVENFKGYISELFVYDEVIKLKSHLEKNGYCEVQIKKEIEAPVSKKYVLINKDLRGWECASERWRWIDAGVLLFNDYFYSAKLNADGICFLDDAISNALEFSEECVEGCIKGEHWLFVSRQKLSEEFIRKYADRVQWDAISIYQSLSEGFIREFSDRVNWKAISKYQSLSESFIREFSDRVNWKAISKYQSLSESFIREFSDYIDWYSLRSPVNAFEEFIASLDTEGLKKVDWPAINQLNLSTGFRKKYCGWLRIGSLSDYDYSPYYDSDYSFDNPYQEWEQELLDDIEAYREDSARSEEDGWYYSDD